MRYNSERSKSQRPIIYFSISHFKDFSDILEMVWLFIFYKNKNLISLGSSICSTENARSFENMSLIIKLRQYQFS